MSNIELVKEKYLKILLQTLGLSATGTKLLQCFVNDAKLVENGDSHFLQINLGVKQKEMYGRKVDRDLKTVEKALQNYVKSNIFLRDVPAVYRLNPEYFGVIPWENYKGCSIKTKVCDNLSLETEIEYENNGYYRVLLHQPNGQDAFLNELLKYSSTSEHAEIIRYRQLITGVMQTYYLLHENNEKDFLSSYQQGSKLIEKYNIHHMECISGLNLYDHPFECDNKEFEDAYVDYVYCIDETGAFFRAFQIEGDERLAMTIDLTFGSLKEMKEDMKNPYLMETQDIVEKVKWIS